MKIKWSWQPVFLNITPTKLLHQMMQPHQSEWNAKRNGGHFLIPTTMSYSTCYIHCHSLQTSNPMFTLYLKSKHTTYNTSTSHGVTGWSRTSTHHRPTHLDTHQTHSWFVHLDCTTDNPIYSFIWRVFSNLQFVNLYGGRSSESDSSGAMAAHVPRLQTSWGSPDQTFSHLTPGHPWFLTLYFKCLLYILLCMTTMAPIALLPIPGMRDPHSAFFLKVSSFIITLTSVSLWRTGVAIHKWPVKPFEPLTVIKDYTNQNYLNWLELHVWQSTIIMKVWFATSKRTEWNGSLWPYRQYTDNRLDG